MLPIQQSHHEGITIGLLQLPHDRRTTFGQKKSTADLRLSGNKLPPIASTTSLFPTLLGPTRKSGAARSHGMRRTIAVSMGASMARSGERTSKDPLVHHYVYAAYQKRVADLAERLQTSTHFSKAEIWRLCDKYKKVLGRRLCVDEYCQLTEHMTRSLFRGIMLHTFEITDDFLLDRIFKVFDVDGNNYINMEEWINGLSVLTRGSMSEQRRFCFDVYDMRHDGELNRDEIHQFLKGSILRPPRDEDPDEMMKDLVEIVINKMDRDQDNVIGYQDYLDSIEEEPLLMEVLGQCLPDIHVNDAFLASFTDNELARKMA